MSPALVGGDNGVASSSNEKFKENEEETKSRIKALENEISLLRAENAALKEKQQQQQQQQEEEEEGRALTTSAAENQTPTSNAPSLVVDTDDSRNSKHNATTTTASASVLSSDQIERYSRQLLLQDGIGGVTGQQKLLSSRVLVVGAGGIGSTVLLYLAACGIGHITILDFDIVERSNLHRQIIHTEDRVGINKAISACTTLKALNPTIDCHPLTVVLSHDNALEIITDHDCIVDASDNPKTRYLINDACVLASKPLISGSAIGSEGQLSVYNHKDDGPCYRCLYPKPTITSGSKSCSDNGVLGPVPGLIGVLQALETIKVLTDTGNTMKNRLLMYDALQCSFFTIKKPKKQPNCPVCSSSNNTIRSMMDSYNDLQSARGPTSCDAYIPAPLEERYQISCQDYHNKYYKTDDDNNKNLCTQQNNKDQQQQSSSHVLLDVRVKEQFDLCSLKNSINIPLDQLQDNMDQIETLTNGWTKPIFTVCRRGVFSVEATNLLNDYILSTATTTTNTNTNTDSATMPTTMMEKQGDSTDARTEEEVVVVKNRATATAVVKNIRGGLEAWRKQVDESFPKY